MRVVIAAGGTGGHIFAALALADALTRDHGAEVRFIGTPGGQEATRVPAAGYRFDAVASAPLYREVSLRAAKAPWVALRSALISGARAQVFVGAGLVAGSTAADEWVETERKSRAMLPALGVHDA